MMKILLPTQTIAGNKTNVSAQPVSTGEDSSTLVFSLLTGRQQVPQDLSQQNDYTDDSAQREMMGSLPDTTNMGVELTETAAIELKTIGIDRTVSDVTEINTTDINDNDVETLSTIHSELLHMDLVESDAQGHDSVSLDLSSSPAVSFVNEQAQIDLSSNAGATNVSYANISAINYQQQVSIAPTGDAIPNQENLRSPVVTVMPQTPQDNRLQNEQRKRDSVLAPIGTSVQASSQSNELPANTAKSLMRMDNSVLNVNRDTLSALHQIKVTTNSGQSVAESTVASDSTTFRTIMNGATANSDSISQWKADALGSNPVQWGQRLLTMLSDKVQLQVGQHLQKAQIRLDPPNLGTIDISISVENERTTVNLVASHQQVRDAISQTLDQLRHNLGVKLNTEVNVSSQSDTSGQGHSRQPTGFKANTIAGQWYEENNESASSQTDKNSEWLNRLV
ncbi:flagellar hook-length control protein FliK [Aestuariibacter sp. A3R04]|uniref:flagellar hook-length control protein FliK n=1 Tax=Aestuariibacter sp. A3R04 TaxID=2841571 RepID=UPI001C0827B9|nr:flagellar hook-length control protein FliK [Aestuariibacter sp. A3R04]MBU3023130.1 flagellar hook-length control protein FliK [Aestuariibacter sp. A3R04]